MRLFSDSCYFQSLTVDYLLNLFFEKYFWGKSSAVKLTELKVLATVTLKPSKVFGKLHKYEINFIQIFLRKAF